MADDVDRAQVAADKHLEAQLQRRKPSLVADGSCHWCLESVSRDSHFCDSDCRDDYEQYERRRG